MPEPLTPEQLEVLVEHTVQSFESGLAIRYDGALRVRYLEYVYADASPTAVGQESLRLKRSLAKLALKAAKAPFIFSTRSLTGGSEQGLYICKADTARAGVFFPESLFRIANLDEDYEITALNGTFHEGDALQALDFLTAQEALKYM